MPLFDFLRRGAPKGPRVDRTAMTYAGLRSIGHSANGPPADSPGLQELGAAFQDYVTAFRLVDEEERAKDR